MKLIQITTVFILFFSTQLLAQPGQRLEKREQMKALKIAFLTDELQLTPDEASNFWPVFNAFEKKQGEIRRQKMKSFLDRKDEESMNDLSEKEAVAMLAHMEVNEEELYQLRKKLIVNLKNILPAIKILKLKRAEEKFNKKLLRQYRENGRD